MQAGQFQVCLLIIMDESRNSGRMAKESIIYLPRGVDPDQLNVVIESK